MTLRKYLLNSLYSLFLAILTLRFFFPFFLSPLHWVINDPGRHWNNGINFLKLGLDSGIDPIMYQIYIFLLHGLTGGDEIPIDFITGLLCASMPLLWYKCVREFLPRTPSLIAGILIGITPTLLNIYGFFMTETLLLNLLGLSMWMTFRTYRKKTLFSFAIAVLCLTIASLTRLAALPIALICIVSLIFLLDQKTKRVAIGLVVFSSLVIPSGLHSYKIINVFAPFGFWQMNAIYKKFNNIIYILHFTKERTSRRYGSPSYFGLSPFAPFDKYKTPRTMTPFSVRIDTSKGMEDWDKTINSIESPPNKILTEIKENFIFFFFKYSWPDSHFNMYKEFIGKDGVFILRHWRWIWLPMTLVIVLFSPFLSGSRKGRFFVFLTLLLILGIIFQQTGVVSGRYRKPLEPFMIISFVIVIYQAIDFARKLLLFSIAKSSSDQACPQEQARQEGDLPKDGRENDALSETHPHRG